MAQNLFSKNLMNGKIMANIVPKVFFISSWNKEKMLLKFCWLLRFVWWTWKTDQAIQVNLCQKHLFLDQLTHTMTKDCSLIYQFSTWSSKHVVYTNCLFFCFCFDIQNNLCTQHVQLAIFMYWICKFNEQSFVILWVSWCHNKCFWKIFTCLYN